jgi:hypothetical protein
MWSALSSPFKSKPTDEVIKQKFLDELNKCNDLPNFEEYMTCISSLEKTILTDIKTNLT